MWKFLCSRFWRVARPKCKCIQLAENYGIRECCNFLLIVNRTGDRHRNNIIAKHARRGIDRSISADGNCRQTGICRIKWPQNVATVVTKLQPSVIDYIYIYSNVVCSKYYSIHTAYTAAAWRCSRLLLDILCCSCLSHWPIRTATSLSPHCMPYVMVYGAVNSANSFFFTFIEGHSANSGWGRVTSRWFVGTRK